MCDICKVEIVKSKTRVPDYEWQCPFCKTKDKTLRYFGNTLTCHQCMRWYNMHHNAKMEWRGIKPDVQMSRAEYDEWCYSTPVDKRNCDYCGIPQKYLPALNQATDLGYVTQIMGVDRIDSKGPYSTSNLTWCCAGCNKAKSNSLSYEEMKTIVGPAMKVVWLTRMGYTKAQIQASKQ